MYMCVYLCTYVCMYVAMYVCPCIYICTHMSVDMYTFIGVRYYMNTMRGSPDNALYEAI